jgi:hypothetical protein
VVVHESKQRALRGKTFSLYGDSAGTSQYYSIIKKLTDLFLQQCPDEKKLLLQLQKTGRKRPFFIKRRGHDVDRELISFIKKTLRDSLSTYTRDVHHHLRSLPFSQRFDSIITTTEEQYHLYMLEIELVNRIYKETFKRCDYKFALLPHCLRDFRPDCSSVSGDVESVCKGCTKECFIHLGSLLLKRYKIKPYISITIEQEKLFKKLKAEHASIGALGIACIPELVMGMRLCIRLGIPPVGIPLDANRCARWMRQAHESSFNLKELEELVK